MTAASCKKLKIHNREAAIKKKYYFLFTAWFEKVYRAKFQSKGRRLVFKTGVIIHVQNDIFLSISIHIFIFVIKFKNNMNYFFCEFDR